ncbi:predicted protein [Phaeodactylum tricornutum CCAP 1055/1]|jgi:hypothetical protein|uniref:Uncharacterized protein n=1 Tax=Phaeodactylum tricornutum (strain CCAP 1055/1) TaxID=556484 RepID=B7G708_PHATC|nr:predicted protein [Phaeodactylum tricornutum CCAP 1055/1]EEC45686.1 predicted protein [Phaeodactylum tricornutum CCAP 1055/1]|eukprot:XP_002182950.1 predicted protein [Phaeodactylum tricornutum CCAP 1055/1]
MAKAKKARKRSLPDASAVGAQSADPNPLGTAVDTFLTSLAADERDGFFAPTLDPERRGAIWMEQADEGELCVNRCSWAIPSQPALNVLRHLAPIVEIGCGANAYWCRLARQAGIDVVGYDMHPNRGGTILAAATVSAANAGSFPVRRGGPSVLAQPENKGRTLFLCYADEDVQEGRDESVSMAAECLKYFSGEYVIHVGELYGDTLSMEQAPWGRSSSPEFQQQLAAQFHCVLEMQLPNWLHVRDTLSVWKRSQTCAIVFAAEDENDQDEEVEYRHIPMDERLPRNRAAPFLEHLLQENGKASATETGGTPSKTEELKRPSLSPTKRQSKKKQRHREEKDNRHEYECPW